MTQTFFVPGPLPGLNEIIAASKGAGGSGAYYAQTKRAWTEHAMVHAIKAKLKPVASANFHYHFVEKNRRRDPSNIFAAVKFIEDGLVAAKVLTNDGWAQVLSIETSFAIGEKPGILVTLTEPS